MKRVVRSAASPAIDVPHPVFVEKSHVKQEFKKRVDINSIRKGMERGVVPPSWMTAQTPRYEDLTQGPKNYMEAFDTVVRAQEAFDALPLEIRRYMDHDFRNLDKPLPKHLFEKYGLVKNPQDAPGGVFKPEAPLPPGKELNPANEPVGAKKAPPGGGA